MPYEKGGRADKKGNKYEINCIVYELLKVLDGSNYSDKPFNKTIAAALRDLRPDLNITPEKAHPWLSNIYPDITIELEDKLVCLEFHYTKKNVPSAIADYVLKKMDTYMRQVENKYPALFK